ncbi:hypothetical protein AMATHDRAFT_1188 [Amanita thiersii Skay4041]|uniref:Uncharacterized protein n=1 Tax=Amanita thiersii Skay4041 TaxID=703135 RepID=A0A2A9NVX1_9AGAR|nr:hypothetical protein AMATHDRAFT_1188 [Amanita thiersii Skay4041]
MSAWIDFDTEDFDTISPQLNGQPVLRRRKPRKDSSATDADTIYQKHHHHRVSAWYAHSKRFALDTHRDSTRSFEYQRPRHSACLHYDSTPDRPGLSSDLVSFIYETVQYLQKAAQHGRDRGRGHLFSPARAFWFCAPLMIFLELLALVWLGIRNILRDYEAGGVLEKLVRGIQGFVIGVDKPFYYDHSDNMSKVPVRSTTMMLVIGFAVCVISVCLGLLLLRATLWALQGALEAFCDVDLGKFYLAWIGADEAVGNNGVLLKNDIVDSASGVTHAAPMSPCRVRSHDAMPKLD